MRFGSTLAILSFCAAAFGKVYFHETFDDDSWEKRGFKVHTRMTMVNSR